MKLLVVSHPAVTAPNQALFARVASRTGWDVDILLPASWRTEYGVHRAERWPGFAGGLLPRNVLLRGNIPLHVYAARIGALIRERRPDAIYVHHEPYGLATAQVLHAARGFDGVFGFYSSQSLVKRYPWPVPAFERAVYRRADVAFAVSETVAGVLREKGYAGHASVLPLPVDVDTFGPSPGRGAAYAPLTVGYIGRLAHEKGVDVLLDALVELPGVRAVVFGEGPARDELIARTEALGIADRVVWRGYVPHERAHEAYGAMDVLVVPSRTVSGWEEQFGRVVIEAMSAGVPVVASSSGELPNLLERTGGGWLFAEGDAGELADRLREAQDSASRERLGECGRRAVAGLFSLDVVADQFAAAMADAALRVGTRRPPESRSSASRA
jgi:glycosyltransferase involved in cell wall biosynthesis